jgi:nucleoside 2-deoxyribosyltransferase
MNQNKRVSVKCFVACPFGWQDVQHIYKNILVPISKDLNIQLLRVDLSNRNDDIDDRIISFLHECDFVVADLTHARPSVYYEVGFAHGLGKQTILIASKDSFISKRDQEPDCEYQARIIHFDLSVKDIIKWSPSTSNSWFRRRLEKKIRAVTFPITAMKRMEAEKKEVREEWEGKSKSQQYSELLKTTLRILPRNHRVYPVNLDGCYYGLKRYRKPDGTQFLGMIIVIKYKNKILNSASYFDRTTIWDQLKEFAGWEKRNISFCNFYCITTESITKSRMMRKFSSFKRLQDSEVIVTEDRNTLELKAITISCHYNRSLPEYTAELKNRINEIERFMKDY